MDRKSQLPMLHIRKQADRSQGGLGRKKPKTLQFESQDFKVRTKTQAYPKHTRVPESLRFMSLSSWLLGESGCAKGGLFHKLCFDHVRRFPSSCVQALFITTYRHSFLVSGTHKTKETDFYFERTTKALCMDLALDSLTHKCCAHSNRSP